MKTNFLVGITVDDWIKLLRDNNFNIHFTFWHRAAVITFCSIFNSFCRIIERVRYDEKIRQTDLKESPVFILGHWRSGATHLQRILAQDYQFAYPNTYQTLFPHTYLTSESIMAKIFASSLPKSRIEDRMAVSFDMPCEDEVAMYVFKSFWTDFGFC